MIMRGWMGMRMMIGIIVFEGGDGWREVVREIGWGD